MKILLRKNIFVFSCVILKYFNSLKLLLTRKPPDIAEIVVTIIRFFLETMCWSVVLKITLLHVHRFVTADFVLYKSLFVLV